MSSLDLPIRNHLREPSSEAELHHVWNQIKALRKPAKKAAPRSYMTSMLLSGGAIALTFLLFWPGVSSQFTSLFGAISVDMSATEQDIQGPLETVAGGRPSILGDAKGADGETPRVWHFAEGSRIRVGEETDLRVMVNDARYFITDLGEGRADFSVGKGQSLQGQSRQWVVQAGDLSAETRGARFHISKNHERVEVSVEAGDVFVKSERLPEHIRHVDKGETFTMLLR